MFNLNKVKMAIASTSEELLNKINEQAKEISAPSGWKLEVDDAVQVERSGTLLQLCMDSDKDTISVDILFDKAQADASVLPLGAKFKEIYAQKSYPLNGAVDASGILNVDSLNHVLAQIVGELPKK